MAWLVFVRPMRAGLLTASLLALLDMILTALYVLYPSGMTEPSLFEQSWLVFHSPIGQLIGEPLRAMIDNLGLERARAIEVFELWYYIVIVATVFIATWTLAASIVWIARITMKQG